MVAVLRLTNNLLAYVMLFYLGLFVSFCVIDLSAPESLRMQRNIRSDGKNHLSIMSTVTSTDKGLFTPSESEGEMFEFFSLISSDCSLLFFAFARCQRAFTVVTSL